MDVQTEPLDWIAISAQCGAPAVGRLDDLLGHGDHVVGEGPCESVLRSLETRHSSNPLLYVGLRRFADRALTHGFSRFPTGRAGQMQDQSRARTADVGPRGGS